MGKDDFMCLIMDTSCASVIAQAEALKIEFPRTSIAMNQACVSTGPNESVIITKDPSTTTGGIASTNAPSSEMLSNTIIGGLHKFVSITLVLLAAPFFL